MCACRSILVVLIVTIGLGCQENDRQTMSENNPFFDPIGFQLIDIPSASQRVLRGPSEMPDDATETTLSTEDGARRAAEEAKSWLRAILKNTYEPSGRTRFLAFRLEEGVCDVVRAVYSIEHYQIATGQSRHMISITVSGFEADTQASSSLEIAEDLARLLLENGERVNFDQRGNLRGGVYGKQISTRDAEKRDWMSFMHWWKHGNRVSFLTLKKEGGPTMEVISPEAEANRDWFEMYR